MEKDVQSELATSEADFVELATAELFDFHERGAYGPALIGPGSTAGYRIRCDRFWRTIEGDPCRKLFAQWLDLIEAQGMPPVYGAYLWRDLVSIARNLVVIERLPESQTTRFRYIGQTIVDRFGRDLTGAELDSFSGQSETEIWRMNRPVFEEGRPGCLFANYGRTGRHFIRSSSLMLPATDPATGEIRFAIGAVSYLDDRPPQKNAPLPNVMEILFGAVDIEKIGGELYRRAGDDPLLEPVFREYSPSMLEHIRTMMFATLACDDDRMNDHYLRLVHRKLVDQNLIGDAEFDRLLEIFGDVLEQQGVNARNKALVLNHMESLRCAVLNR